MPAKPCRRGATTAGVVYSDGVVLIADRRIPNPKLAEASSLEKIHQIDENILCATAGLVADARVLVDYARLSAQINRVTYAEPMSVEILVRRICDYKQQYTQFGGVRPFGTALLVGGYDDGGIHLFETEPSGSLTSFKAASTGGNKGPVMDLFEQKSPPRHGPGRRDPSRARGPSRRPRGGRQPLAGRGLFDPGR